MTSRRPIGYLRTRASSPATFTSSGAAFDHPRRFGVSHAALGPARASSRVAPEAAGHAPAGSAEVPGNHERRGVDGDTRARTDADPSKWENGLTSVPSHHSEQWHDRRAERMPRTDGVKPGPSCGGEQGSRKTVREGSEDQVLGLPYGDVRTEARGKGPPKKYRPWSGLVSRGQNSVRSGSTPDGALLSRNTDPEKGPSSIRMNAGPLRAGGGVGPRPLGIAAPVYLGSEQRDEPLWKPALALAFIVAGGWIAHVVLAAFGF